jgi:hypothetical protein
LRRRCFGEYMDLTRMTSQEARKYWIMRSSIIFTLYEILLKVKQSRYTPCRRLGGDEV